VEATVDQAGEGETRTDDEQRLVALGFREFEML
jgi:hypothetical protein